MSDEVKRGSGPDGWVPEFEGQRPPLESGNALGVRHGAYAVLVLKPRAEEIAATLREGMGNLYAGQFEGAIAAAAMTGAQLERAMGALADAESASAMRRLDQDARGWMRLWLHALSLLGLTPASAARLGLDLARTGDELARHLAERYGDRDEPAAIESEESSS